MSDSCSYSSILSKEEKMGALLIGWLTEISRERETLSGYLEKKQRMLILIALGQPRWDLSALA